uniref:H/ACA ribonucleoprotein complex subunit 2 n=2 Tax=Oryzias TaxID=8089 RepID=A0A3P9J210_ORYLA
MTKVKKEKLDAEEPAGVPERSYHELIANLNPIAQPLASRKLSKKLYKCVKKAARVKNIRRGVKEVQKFINKGEKGIVVLAGDTLPIEVYCHLPVMCEDRSLPYAYIPSKVSSIFLCDVHDGQRNVSFIQSSLQLIPAGSSAFFDHFMSVCGEELVAAVEKRKRTSTPAHICRSVDFYVIFTGQSDVLTRLSSDILPTFKY